MAVTSTVGKVTIGYSGPELVVTPAGTGNSNVDTSPAPVQGLYNQYDPTTLLQNLPVVTGYLPAPTAVAVAVNSGTGTTTSYQVVATLGTQDSVPSTTVTVSGAATPNNTVSWAYVPGATGYKVIRTAGGATQGLISTITNPLTLTLADAGLVASAYTASTTNPTLSLAARIVDANGTTSATFTSYGLRVDPGVGGVVYPGTSSTTGQRGGTTVTVAGGANHYVFNGIVVRSVRVQNNTSAPVYVAVGSGTALDATQGDTVIPANANAVLDISGIITWVSLYTAGAGVSVNGTGSGGVVITGVQTA